MSLPKAEVIRTNQGTFADYISIARLDHSIKHVFIIPGCVLAFILRGVHTDRLFLNVIFGFIAAFSIASANYVINEWFDRESDKHHPTKRNRSAVQRVLRGDIVCIEWLAFLVVGISSAYAVGVSALVTATVFALQGIVYNVPGIRSKDRAYLDVISESINNPLRLLLGWSMVDAATLPPSSVILGYWFGGAFLMTAKRLSEYREIVASHGRELLTRYRASFKGYDDISLTVASFIYALLSSFLFAIFFVKYRIEYILLMPIVICLLGYYFYIALRAGSSAQKPEKLFQDKTLMLLVLTLVIVFILTTFTNFPILNGLTEQRFITI